MIARFVYVHARWKEWDLRANRSEVERYERSIVVKTERSWALDVPANLLNRADVALPGARGGAVECVHRISEALIEPKDGFVMLSGPTCFPDALLNSSVSRGTLDEFRSFRGVPNRRATQRLLRNPTAVRRLPLAATMRHTFDDNYYHFTVDVATRLELFNRLGVPRDIPLLISPTLAAQRFFVDAISRPGLASMNWQVQHEHLILDELVVAQALPGGSAAGIAHYVGLLGLTPRIERSDRHVFFDRLPRWGRTYRNRDQVLAAAERAGFEIVDMGELSLAAQAELAASCATIASVHGAALTNMVFRVGGDLKVVEILPPHETSVDYMILAARLGYQYRWIRALPTGRRSNRYDNFDVDPVALGEALAS